VTAPKRYLLFAGFNYYPCGGWDDFIGSFDTQEEATKAGVSRKANIERYAGGCADWFQVVDSHTGEKVEDR
jgi:hypothetical protein